MQKVKTMHNHTGVEGDCCRDRGTKRIEKAGKEEGMIEG